VDCPSDLTTRFSADLAALWSGEGRLALAVSGGPDSLALLILANAALPGRISAAATVDHGLAGGKRGRIGRWSAKSAVSLRLRMLR
jgi:tRNA(Ile)-lysidine synthase